MKKCQNIELELSSHTSHKSKCCQLHAGGCQRIYRVITIRHRLQYCTTGSATDYRICTVVLHCPRLCTWCSPPARAELSRTRGSGTGRKGLPSPMIHLILSSIPQQAPFGLRINPLSKEIVSWLTSLLQNHPEKE